MKKGRFLWSAHRITERQKAGKARNIKEKRQSKNFNTASRPPAARPSSPSVDFLFGFSKMPPVSGGIFQTVNKVYFFDLCCKSLAEFRRPQTAEEGQIVFSGGVYVGKHTSQAASVRAKASARSGLHPLEKMLAFLRSVSKFFDRLRGERFYRFPLSLSRNPAMHQA